MIFSASRLSGETGGLDPAAEFLNTKAAVSKAQLLTVLVSFRHDLLIGSWMAPSLPLPVMFTPRHKHSSATRRVRQAAGRAAPLDGKGGRG